MGGQRKVPTESSIFLVLLFWYWYSLWVGRMVTIITTYVILTYWPFAYFVIPIDADGY